MSRRKMMLNSRKGQITIFIIIGIILLFSTATVLYIKNKITEQRVEEIVSEMQDVPNEVQPVRNFVDQCLASVSKRAINLIGAHGGYIGLSPEAHNYTNTHFVADPTGLDPTSYEAVRIYKDKNYTVPYWWFMSSSNDAKQGYEFESRMPSLYVPPEEEITTVYSINEQIAKYVELNIDDCLANFARIEEQGFTVEAEQEPAAYAIIGEEDVTIALDYPLRITDQQGDDFELSEFKAKHDVNLKDVYELANDLLDILTDSLALERVALNVISAYSGLDTDVPPMAGVEIGTVPSGMWLKYSVEEELALGLQSNIPLLKVSDQNKEVYPVHGENDWQAALYNNLFQVSTLNKTYDNTEVRFSYMQDWPLYLDISGQTRIGPTTKVQLPSPFDFIPGVFQYNTPYDVSFPVRVEISQTDAFNGEGYDFNFFYEANIRNNEPLESDFVSEEMAYTSGLLLCEYNQRNTGNITVEVVDTGGNPVEDAVVMFAADEVCTLGQTKIDEVGVRASLTAKFPVAFGALEVSHKDYLKYRQKYMTKVNMTDLVRVELIPKIYKNVTAKTYNLNKMPVSFPDDSYKHDISYYKNRYYRYDGKITSDVSFDWTSDEQPEMPTGNSKGYMTIYDRIRHGKATGEEYEHCGERNALRNLERDIGNLWKFSMTHLRELRPDEIAIISLERKRDSIYDPEFKTTVYVEGDEISKAYLAPGTYDAKFVLVQKNADLLIPACPDCLLNDREHKPGRHHDKCKWDDFNATTLDAVPECTFDMVIDISDPMVRRNDPVMFKLIRFNLVDVPQEMRTLMDMKALNYLEDTAESGVYDTKLRPTTVQTGLTS